MALESAIVTVASSLVVVVVGFVAPDKLKQITVFEGPPFAVNAENGVVADATETGFPLPSTTSNWKPPNATSEVYVT